MVCLIINGKTLPHADKLADCLKDISGMSSIMININKERTNVILGSECSVIWGIPISRTVSAGLCSEFHHSHFSGQSCADGKALS